VMVVVERADVDPDYVTRLLAHRAPELVDLVVPVSVLEHVLTLLAAIEARTEALEARANPTSSNLLFN